jgi:chromosomal replication initiator protein
MQILVLEIWDRLRAELCSRVGERPYRAWIEPLEVLRLFGGVLTLTAPNRWIADRAARSYGKLLEDRVQQELGAAVRVVIQAAPSSARERERIDPRATPPAAVDADLPLIVDQGNRVAYLMLEAIAAGKGEGWNPLVLYGAPGVGKTALLRFFVRQSTVPARFYLALDLHEEFVRAARHRDLANFRERFRDCRCLVIDEFHRLKGKARMQTELMLWLAELPAQVLVASRHHPRRIQRLDSSLTSRLLGGFVAEVQPPHWEARMQFVRRLENQHGALLDDDSVTTLADLYRGGYAGLRAAWVALRRVAGGLHAATPGALRKTVLEVLATEADPFERILTKVASRFVVQRQELLNGRQTRRLRLPKQVVQFLAVQQGMSAAEVGRRMAGRTRAAVSYACRSFASRLTADEELARLVKDLS